MELKNYLRGWGKAVDARRVVVLHLPSLSLTRKREKDLQDMKDDGDQGETGWVLWWI